MNHSVFKGDTGHLLTKTLTGQLTAEDAIKQIEGFRDPEHVRQALVNLFFAKINIALHGYTTLSAKSERWDSEISEKTLQGLVAKDIKFPFEACAIELSHGTVFFTRSEDFVIFSLPLGSDANRLTLRAPFGIVGQKISDIALQMPEEGKKVFYTTMSILLYTSLFKHNRVRVPIPKLIKGKGSKKRGIPKHNMNIVSLRQGEDIKIYDAARTEAREKSNKTWIVRGHWRNQWYSKEEIHKPKWIDPHWKGAAGNEMITKTYKA